GPVSAFTPEQEKVLKSWDERYPAPLMGLVEALRQVQEWHRCVSDEDEEDLAGLFVVPRSRIHELATFFPSFTQKPAGRHRIGLCRGLSCSLAGSKEMCACLEKKLGIKAGETTADGRLSLETMECLGACDQAPALIVNDELQGAATEQMVDKLLEELE
ncbi:MAG: NAD(P)H-dependent oxidoreductase subunit E, partial [Elusimicrobia bacterium]|nr:NAD(P)H-dependent oxidoreductase subunit E [Elusimicrobiota bacterium]